MAIKTFKEIIENKGYRISSKDRQIFEQGTLQSFFGFSDSDMIEFIVYDINDNQLPQGEDGKLVRYIPLSSENIKDYFLIADGTEFQAFQFPNEYFIDAERLLNEAGYNNGIFKTQITLLNKRVGFDSPNEKMWIKEISPSRTEVKLLPIINEVSKKTDLLTRFDVMVSGQDFRDDVTPYISNFISTVNPSEVDTFIKKIYGDKWYNKMVAEFGIAGFDRLMTGVYNKFAEAMKFEFSNRYSQPTQQNYGKKRPTNPSLKFSKEDVYKVAQRIIVEIVDAYLPARTIQARTEVDTIFDESYDKVGQVLQRRASDVLIESKRPVVNVTKKKPDIEKAKKDFGLEKEIKKEVPTELPIPKFSEPNILKSTKKSNPLRRLMERKKENTLLGSKIKPNFRLGEVVQGGGGPNRSGRDS